MEVVEEGWVGASVVEELGASEELRALEEELRVLVEELVALALVASVGESRK